ncbi:hypothetical protein K8D10_22760 [Aeromonas veronii]|uniref:chitinase n=1 Tax=Aeromonas veronii TaxID=654 RepID=UPI00207D6AB7|nr:glycosyl hydrolase family 18 protein [Aeromonas veronii]MCO4174561.1 hypothetical protein [Aeromonas veronii]
MYKIKCKHLALCIISALFTSVQAKAGLEAWNGQVFAEKGAGEVIFGGGVYKNEWWVGPDQCPLMAATEPANNGWRFSRVATTDEITSIGNPSDCIITTDENPDDSKYEEFSYDSSYTTGDIVSLGGVTYKATQDVRPKSFSPGSGNPWSKYTPLMTWENNRVYHKGDEVVGTDGNRYMALFYVEANVDPVDVENQNPTQQNSKPWYPKGEWHNFTQEELAQVSEINLESIYQHDTLVKYNSDYYFNKVSVQGVLPDGQTPWKVYIDWGNTKELVGSPKTEWPKQFYAPYIDFVMNDVPDMVKLKNEKGVNNFVLAFIVAKDENTCLPTWGTSYPVNGYKQYSKVKALRDAGGDVMVSVGGANNSPMAVACKNIDDLVEVYDGIVKNLNLKVLDFDIEGMAVADSESIERRNQALAILQQRWISEGRDIKLWYTLPIIPEGLTADGMAVLTNAKKHGVRLDGINVMTMDYGRPQCQSDNTEGQKIHGKCATTAIESLFEQVKSIFNTKSDDEIWSMLGTTPMIGYNDVKGEVFYKSDAELVLEHAKTHNLGMIGIWSLLRDRPGVSGQVSPEHSGLTSEQADTYEFSRIFTPFAESGLPTIDEVSANAGLDQVIVGPETIMLDGSSSHIPANVESINFQWTQVSGHQVALNNPTAAITSFNVDAIDAHYEFKLKVTADGHTSEDIVAINVTASEIEPVISIIGDHLEVKENDTITIGTTTNLNDVGNYSWTISPDGIDFIDGGSSLTFTAPVVNENVIYNVNVVLSDKNGHVASDSTRLVVQNTENEIAGDGYQYIFPAGVNNYVAGTRVLFSDKNIYECFGDWAASCQNQSLAPTVAADPNWWMQQWRVVGNIQ